MKTWPMPLPPLDLFGRRWIDHISNFRDLVAREAAASRMFADHVLVRRAVDAEDFIVGDVAVHPLDRRAEVLEDRTRRLRCLPEVVSVELPGARHFSFDHVLGHCHPPSAQRMKAAITRAGQPARLFELFRAEC